MSLFTDLKRRIVFKVGLAYSGAAWSVVRGAEVGGVGGGAPGGGG